ncbi:MAG: hypothetical protein A3H97_14105 [Acidobacteria bacterium RIFCSPLOWO2_02_FULL_65_29]|nr:MAG: hypothetical protein A3H97_14105 [Acidobacteria bacterium RIFCSPLOWO2_02_FULL_65_29]
MALQLTEDCDVFDRICEETFRPNGRLLAQLAEKLAGANPLGRVWVWVCLRHFRQAMRGSDNHYATLSLDEKAPTVTHGDYSVL